MAEHTSQHKLGTDLENCTDCRLFALHCMSVYADRAERIELNTDDPFDTVLIDIIKMNRKKRADYAADADIFSNFRDIAFMLGLPGFSERESALFNILQKIARLKSLRANGRMANPANESVVDTVLDLAVYSIIYLALSKEVLND